MTWHFDADHLADSALRLVAALTTLAFAGFILTLAFATSAARADTTCTGTDLLAAMERDDPDAWRALTEEAQASVNGEAMLWRVTSPGGAISHLYGTMHVTDPRITQLPSQVEAAFDASRVLVIETTDILDPAAMMAAMAERPELMMFTGTTTLSSLLDDDEREMVESALQERGLSLASLDRMKPWMIAAMATLPVCEMTRKAAGVEILDVALATRADEARMEIEGLETTAEQLGAMAALPLDFHMRALVETLALGDRIDDIIETMIAIHQRGEPGLFWPFFEATLAGGADDAIAIAGFEQSVITDRNRTMASRMKARLEDGDAFVAVGALHLPGEEGIVALLRDAGFEVTAP